MRVRVWNVVVVIVVAGTAVIWALSRNPERQALDDAARASAPGRFVRLRDGLTHYDVSGPDTGQRVLLVHGFSVPSYIWDSTVTALTGAGFRVARYDVVGRGYSDRPNLPYTADLFDRQLVELLDSLGWRAAVDLVGLSFGGPVSAVATGRHPDRVRSLTLVDPAAGPRSRLPWYIRAPVIGPLLWQTLAVPGMADGQFSDFLEPNRWPDWADRYRVQMRYRGFGRALRSTLTESADVPLDSVYARVGETATPTLLLWGTEDQTVRIEHAAGVRKAIPQAEFHAIERSRHLPHMERTDVVNPLLIGFLRRALAGDSARRSTRLMQ